MTFDFDFPVNRRGSGCMKWDEDPSVDLPLWVADMDFTACPAVRDALAQRLSHGVFGYAITTRPTSCSCLLSPTTPSTTASSAGMHGDMGWNINVGG